MAVVMGVDLKEGVLFSADIVIPFGGVCVLRLEVVELG
jgi:hypothetical protein